MRAQPDDGGTDHPEPTTPSTAEEPIDEGGFYRGATATATRNRQPQWWRPGRYESARPQRWVSYPMILVVVLAGFVPFSAVWNLLGDGVLAVPLASLAGVGAGFGFVLAVAAVWRRLSDAPDAAG